MNNMVNVEGTSSDVFQDIAKSLRDIATAVKSGGVSPTEKPLTEEERGIMLVLRLPNPTERSVAKAMGYRDHTALRKFPAVKEAIYRWKIMKTVTGGSRDNYTGIDDIE